LFRGGSAWSAHNHLDLAQLVPALVSWLSGLAMAMVCPVIKVAHYNGSLFTSFLIPSFYRLVCPHIYLSLVLLSLILQDMDLRRLSPEQLAQFQLLLNQTLNSSSPTASSSTARPPTVTPQQPNPALQPLQQPTGTHLPPLIGPAAPIGAYQSPHLMQNLTPAPTAPASTAPASTSQV